MSKTGTHISLIVVLLLGAMLLATVGACAGSDTTSTPTPAPGELFLEITSPEDQTVIRTQETEVVGKTLPTAIVSVNGTLTSVDAMGAFSATVTLESGPNLIEVVASTIGGDELGKVLAVIYIP